MALNWNDIGINFMKKLQVVFLLLTLVALATAITRLRSVQIVQSSIDSTTVGFAVPSSGRFTSVSMNGTAFTHVQTVKSSSLCTTGSSSYDNCSNTLFWPNPFVDSAYAVTCSGTAPGESGAGNNAPTLNMVSYNANSVTVITQTQRSQTAHFTEVHCVGVHP